MFILAIDPGNIQSGYCLYDAKLHAINKCGIAKNHEMRQIVAHEWYNVLAVEMIASYGMPVGREVFDTCVHIGRFIQIVDQGPAEITWKIVYRKDVKMYLCHSMRAKDANIRQAILDKFPATGGGKTPQIGTKKEPGPLYGVKGDIWAAVGVALTATRLYNLDEGA